MIGTRAFLLQLAFLVLPLLILFGIAAGIIRSRKGRSNAPSGAKFKMKGGVAVLIFVLLATSGGFRLTRGIQSRHVLRSTQGDSVYWIQVGGTRLDKPSDVRAVILAMGGNQWYEPTAGDGGQAQLVDLVMHFKSGEEQRYPIARHRRYNGAVIHFISQDRNSISVWHYGYGFAAHLPDVLDELGAHLPIEK